MSNKINIDHLAKEIAKELSQYSVDIVEMIDISSERAGKMAVKKLKTTSPYLTKEYRKHWRMKTEPEPRQPSTQIVYVASPEYSLAHLLERGHAKRSGGRVEGIPHIKPVEDEVIKEFMQEVEEAIRNG